MPDGQRNGRIQTGGLWTVPGAHELSVTLRTVRYDRRGQLHRRLPRLARGGQACVLYGGAEFSRDLDVVLAAHPDALAPTRVLEGVTYVPVELRAIAALAAPRALHKCWGARISASPRVVPPSSVCTRLLSAYTRRSNSTNVGPVDPAPIALAPDDAALVARIRAGDARAFEQLFRAYYRPLCQFMLAYVHSLDIVEEHVQQVFWWMWEQREQLPVQSGLRAYLYTAVRHRALNHIKRRGVAARWAAQAVPDLGLAGIGQGPPDAERTMRQRDVSAALARAIAQLPERRRQAFALAWQHGLTNAETAAVMGISVKAVEAALAKAIASLREVLAPIR